MPSIKLDLDQFTLLTLYVVNTSDRRVPSTTGQGHAQGEGGSTSPP